MKDFGLLEGIRDEQNYVFGDGNVPVIPYQEDGNWEKFLPRYEAQEENFETYACTVWGTQNAIETLHTRIYGIEPNYSERFTAVLSGLTGAGGTDPQIPCESIRKDGLIDNRLLPMTKTKTEFFNPRHVTAKLIAKGKEWLLIHQFRHDWVWKGERPQNYIELLRDALKTSPLGVSVSAWNKVNGVFVSDQGSVNNHWCMLYKIDEEGYPWVFDSYDHSKKKLSKDHNIRRAKRFFLNKISPRAMRRHKGILENILKRLLMKPDLLDVCEAWMGKDASPSDLAPDELGCAETVTNLLKKVYPETPILTGTWTLWDYLRNPKNGYVEVREPSPETIIICATVPGKPFPGHVGIFQSDMLIASNDSRTGTFIKNFTYQTWMERYMTKGGYKVYLYNRKIK
jgi:hypothetical protein